MTDTTTSKIVNVVNVSDSISEKPEKLNDFYFILFVLNLLLRFGLLAFSPFKESLKKNHIKESCGVSLIIFLIFVYIYYYTDYKDTLRNNEKNCIKFTIYSLLFFSIFMYDYLNIVLMQVDKKYFGAKIQNQGILSGIMIAIIFGIFVLYYLTIVLYSREPFYPFASKTVYQFAFIQGSKFLGQLFMLSFLGFLIVNINKIDFNESNPIKAIFGSIVNSEENRLNNNKNNRKEFFIDMFKKYYMVFILLFCILLVVLDLNRIEFYSFVESIYPCPPTQTE